MRRTPLYLTTLLALLLGCMTPMKHALYDIGMDAVERPANFKDRYSDTVITRVDSSDVVRYTYSDSLITITWTPLPSQFLFLLENKSQHSMKIIWDEAAFVGADGQSARILHSGVKYIDRSNPQPPTVVVRGGKVSDMVLPVDNVYFVSGQYGGWSELGIFEPYSAMTIASLEPAKKHIGKKAQVLLPIEIQGTVNEYIFQFTVKDVKIPVQ